MKPEKHSFSGLKFFIFIGILTSCDTSVKNSFQDNSPTSGELNVYFDEGLQKHVNNQAYTFEAMYNRASLRLFPSTETEAIHALYNDSCEAIVISRLLNPKEKEAFASKKYDPKYSLVAKSGVALICNTQMPLSRIRYSDVLAILKNGNTVVDSLGNVLSVSVLIDKGGSSVNSYLSDSLLNGAALPSYCTSLNSSTQTINYVASHSNALAFIDFAWLSDTDDSIYNANKEKIRILAIGTRFDEHRFEKPNQSSFKLNTYPFCRNVYVMRKTGDFTLAKGFESFVAGPKGQLIFLKQGLLPGRQGERSVHVNLETNNSN